MHEELSTGHARALLSVENSDYRIKLARKVADENLTVRETERLVKEPEVTEKAKPEKKEKKSYYPDVENELSKKYGTKVRIKGSSKGKIEIEFYSVADLTRIVDLL